ncbi:MAG: demethoxyubiquinone hydroxylase family protein [Steroidobacteraceae bacterium]|nr:demethoxyubiquinone hydroxylase family protein [Steroidobacteraceae bacterium]
MKVNHAGEHGAVCIYSAQIQVSRVLWPSAVKDLVEFRSHELRHRSIFQAELLRRGRPRCRSYWLCGIGGYTLGFFTACCGKTAIAATTAAVETVVLRHLESQLAALGTSDPMATVAIRAIADDERQHQQVSAAAAGSGLWYKVLTPLVAASTEAVWS